MNRRGSVVFSSRRRTCACASFTPGPAAPAL